jgi:3-oxoadipate enol-lactonase
MTLCYDINGKGEPLLLLHGALVSRAMWQPQLTALSPYYQVIMCDLPAHGDSSDVPGDYTIAKLSDAVADLLDALNIQRTYVCGHSLGGMVAQQLAVTQRARIGKLILAETAFGTHHTFWKRLQTLLGRPFLHVTPPRMLVKLAVQRYGTTHSHVAHFIQQEMSQYDRVTTMRVMNAAFSFAGKTHLQRIVAPTLVLVAVHNTQTYAQGYAMAHHIPNAQMKIIPHAHHLLNLDNPQAFNRAVIRFLNT